MYRFRDTYNDNDEPYRISTNYSSRPHHFKFEHSGMLVYDSKALLICGGHSETGVPLRSDTPRTISSYLEKELEYADESGNCYTEAFYYRNMKNYPPCPVFPYEYVLEIPNDSVTLRFNSKFESGNLYKAVKLSDYEYLLFIHNDIGTYNQNHWYYFSVVNPRKTPVTFKIANMRKKDLLYMSGMQPAVYSNKIYKETGTKWHRDGNSISYNENVANGIVNFVGRQKYYTLQFTYSFKHENDEVFFAYSVPYTYTDLTHYLNTIQNDHSDIALVSQLCKTIAGNVCYKLIITENVKNYVVDKKNSKKKIEKVDKFKKRKGIVFMARVHSGETVSSYMMKGAIDYLLSAQGKSLRKNYVFCIVPMLNPDGVRYGNYRASLLGVDLNRRWKHPNKILHPTVFHAKKMIEDLKERHQIMLVCDMHGHTKKKNVFMYGCSLKSPENFDKERNLLARVIPFMMSRKNAFFSFADSHFRVEKGKESTARIVLFQEFEIVHSYTMEASFFGPSSSESFGHKFNGNMHMSPEDLSTLGQDLCKCCNSFNSQKVYSRKILQTNTFLKNERIKNDEKVEIDEEIHEEEIGVIVKEKLCENIEVEDVGVDPESSGSDSEPSDSEPNLQVSVKKRKKTAEKSIKNEPVPSRTPTSTIKPINAKKNKSLETDWSLKRANRSPITINSAKPSEVVQQQNFLFPLQNKFNPFALEIKLKSEIPELEVQKKFTPKISKSQKKPPVIYSKPKNTELFLPALLNVNLPDAQTLFSRSIRKRGENEGQNEVVPRQVFHVGSASYGGNL